MTIVNGMEMPLLLKLMYRCSFMILKELAMMYSYEKEKVRIRLLKELFFETGAKWFPMWKLIAKHVKVMGFGVIL